MAHGAFNLRTMDWHQEVITALGLEEVHWPKIHPSGEIVGTFVWDGQNIPCYTPVGDFQCALVGALLQEQELSLNISTGSQVSMLVPGLEPGNYQTRPFFDGATVNTITHIPAGRSLNALLGLLTELMRWQGIEPADPWDYIIREAELAEETELRVDLAFFQSSCGERGGIWNIQERDLNIGSLFRAAFRNMAQNYYACACRLSPDERWQRLVFSGGLAQRIGLLREFIMEIFRRPGRLAPSREDTLLGLLILARAWSGRSSGVLAAGRELLQISAEKQLGFP